jgi:hypothetical protein
VGSNPARHIPLKNRQEARVATGFMTQTELVNAALAELGSTARIIALDDGSNSARRAAALWANIVRMLLEQHPWNFALRRAQLNPLSAPPPFGYARAFQLPDDCVRWLPAAHGDPDFRAAEMEGRLLLTDADDMPVRYIAMVTSVADWPPSFANTVMLYLAAAMAEGITQSESIKDRLAERGEMALRRAKRLDGLQTGATRRAHVTASSGWLGARRRGWTAEQR